MRGLILAGGRGSRLGSLTVATNKHLLPIGDQPMITRVLQTMLDAGITEVMIVTNPEHLNDFAALTSRDEPPYNAFDCIYFVAQRAAIGIADAINQGRHFFTSHAPLFVLLGDTLVTDGRQFRSIVHAHEHDHAHDSRGAHIWTYSVDDPSDYGVLVVDSCNTPVAVAEKPKTFISKLAIPGIYLFDSEIWSRINTLKMSARGELEVTDLIRMYIAEGQLTWHELRGKWADPGRSVDHYYSVATEMFK